MASSMNPDAESYHSNASVLRLTCLLTPWCRILFEKLIVTQLVKQYPAFFMELEGSLPCSQKPATWTLS
jgi:hypothetical protein